MENKKSGLTIILVIIIAILCLVVGILIGDKFLGSNDKVDNDANVEEKNESEDLTASAYTPKCIGDNSQTFTVYGDVSKYSNVFDYIEDQKDVAISLNYCTNEVEGTGEAGVIYKRADYNLTKDEITTFLTEMKNSKAEYLTGGFGALCAVNATISYKMNNIENNIMIVMGMGQIISSTDGNIYKIIDSNVTESIPQYYCLYSVGNLNQTATNIVKRLNK